LGSEEKSFLEHSLLGAKVLGNESFKEQKFQDSIAVSLLWANWP